MNQDITGMSFISVIMINYNVQQCLKYPVETCHYKFQLPIHIHLEICFCVMNGVKYYINIKFIAGFNMGKPFLPSTNNSSFTIKKNNN